MQPSQQPNVLGYVSLIIGILSLALVCLFAIAGLVEFIDSVTGIPPHGILPVNRLYARQVIWSEGIAVAGIVSGVAALLKKERGNLAANVGLALNTLGARVFLPAAATAVYDWLVGLLERLI